MARQESTAVQAARRKARPAHAAFKAGRARAADPLFAFDEAFGSSLVAGADEVGRGCLAGPLVAAAVLLDYRTTGEAERTLLAALGDSKQIKGPVRAQLYPLILRCARQVSVVSRSPRTIDRNGLHVTNLEAMQTALEHVRCDNTVCLVDGFELKEAGFDHHQVIKGDASSAAIAAASVVAKEVRDRYMRRAAELHPGYGFDGHVGYITAEHKRAVRELGITPLHRRSYNCDAYQPYIRRARADEARQLRAARLEAVSDTPSAFGATIDTTRARDATSWQQWAAEGSAGEDQLLLAVVEPGGRWRGLGCCRKDGAGDAEVLSMWVASELRGRGLGRQLLEQLRDWAVSVGARTLRISVNADNVSARQLYETTGYEIVADKPWPGREPARILRMAQTLTVS